MRFLLTLLSLFFLFQFVLINNIKSQNIVKKQILIENDSVRKYTYQGFEYLYDFHFKSTDSIIGIMQKKYPKSSWTYVLKSNYYWWKIISGDISDKCKKDFYLSLAEAEKILKNKNGNENLFCSILIHSYKARFELINKKYITALTQ